MSRTTNRCKRRCYAAQNVDNFHGTVVSDQIVVFAFGSAPELSRWAVIASPRPFVPSLSYDCIIRGSNETMQHLPDCCQLSGCLKREST